jgi:hypothetical protein
VVEHGARRLPEGMREEKWAKKSPLRERAEVYFLGGDRGDSSIMLHRSRLRQLNLIMTVIGLMHNAIYTSGVCSGLCSTET